MNIKIFTRISYIILLINIMLSLISTGYEVKAKDTDGHTLDGIISGADSFISARDKDADTISTDDMKDISDGIYNVLLTIGIIIAILIASILGIQFMIATAEDKAKIKESIIPFIVGCIVVFGAFAIWRAIVIVFK